MEQKLNKKLNDNSILEEAHDIVNNRSRGQDANIVDSFQHIAYIASAIRQRAFTPRDISAVMIALKLSREQYAHKRDNLVDAAGYIQIDYILAEHEAYKANKED